jgi:hypothetical protein
MRFSMSHVYDVGVTADELADETILKPAAEEEASKSFDEEALHEWEVKVNEGMRWEGRSEP